MIKYILILAISLITFFNTPPDYSWKLNTFALALFILLFLFLYKDSKDKNQFNFNILFSISFLFTSFIYPVFFFLTNTYDIPFFVYGFNKEVINKSTMIALIGYNLYCIGAFNALKTKRKFTFKNKKYYNKINILIVYILFFLFLSQVGALNLLKSYYGGTNTWGGISRYIFFILIAFLWVTVIIELNNKQEQTIIRTILKMNKWLLCLILLYCSFFLIVGNRANILSLLIIIVGYLTMHVRKMNTKVLSLIILTGFFLLSLLSLFRINKDNLSEDIWRNRSGSAQSILSLGSDLMISNYTLYLLVDDANMNGYTYGHTMVGPILGVFPFMMSSYINISGDKEENLTSSLYITEKTLGNQDVGLGTNIVGDLYLSFGLPGVCIGLYLLGLFVNRMRIYASTRKLSYNIVYLIMLSWSIMLPRAEYFVYLRGLTWAIGVFLIISTFHNIRIRQKFHL
ncbi:MAG: O-antigen polysaccharide polymerase Wzy [Bacteroidaceae bacterium]|nr:O-antigen polysaccharide polymerase Wzy [Bacteroidaceae bacterium]